MTTATPTVSEIVRHDYRAADVFKKWGINYCCGGNLPLADVCHLQGLNQGAVENELEEA
ncbi:MAG: iron-sulfur cluster repair di-iron protein, partial [Sphingobacteriales bacterium]